jgi:antitoxin (DNA-binding transcriptional repressor) of toxin-antitoxin stability system
MSTGMPPSLFMMHTVTADDLKAEPQRLLDDARKGQADIVFVEGQPLMLTVPLGPPGSGGADRLELAVSLYEHDLIGLGLAAKVAGVSYSRMIDELGERRIPVVRYDGEDLERELAYVRTLAGGR